MTTEVFLAIVIVCGIFAACEVFGKLTRYAIPTLVLVMFVFIIFGGELKILPEDLLQTTGFYNMTYTFVLPFVLASFGTSMSISGLKSESRTVITSLIAVACIVLLGVIAGLTFMDLRTAIYGSIEVAGGGQAGLIFLTALQAQEGTETMVALMLCLMSMQLIFGYPLCSFAMRKSIKLRLKENRIPALQQTVAAAEKKPLIPVPAWLKGNFYYIFAMLGVICFLSQKLYELTTLSAYLWYILLGFLFAELGILEHNCLMKAGHGPVLLSIMYATILASFLTLKLSSIGGVALNFAVLIFFGIAGCAIAALIVSKLFKVDFFEAYAISIGCMVGYPPSQKITEEALQAIRASQEISDETAECLKSYYEPKIIISGVVSISLVTGILAGIVVSFL